MAEALGAAAELFFVPARLGMMLLGVLAGLVVGILPGMGGVVAVAGLLPFVVRLAAGDSRSLAAPQVLFSVGQISLLGRLLLTLLALGVFGLAEIIGILARGGAIAERV